MPKMLSDSSDQKAKFTVLCKIIGHKWVWDVRQYARELCDAHGHKYSLKRALQKMFGD